ncbi:alpha/beta hydrolase [Lentzea xinjiangensis]|uniref:alpha/beta hydrolase n=1 Tax=Lentzea xinjiangensis TaxID=402600 RepID=UPI001FEAF7B2|nr:alpha/beta hydrolase [Lentzea xinjiangensis]
MAVTRVRAADPAKRIGTLFFNPGGPGNAARHFIRDSAPETFPAELLGRFDVVGVDPRGVGDSRPLIACRKPTSDHTRYPRSREEFDRLISYNRDLARGCREATGPLIDHVDTISAARDFDAVRSALGERQVSWIGLSYGTLLAATYARLYPERVRAAVLDGPLDHAVGSRRLVVEEAASAENVFGLFADWCASDPACALHGRDVRAEYRSLLDRAPLHADGFPAGVTADQVGFGTYGRLIFRSAWSGLAADLAAAGTNAAAFATVAPTSPAYRVITCHDLPTGDIGYTEFAARQAEMLRAGPTIRGYIEAWDVHAGCLGWPIKPANPWGSIPVRGTPPILVVAGTDDPATPHSWGVGMASQIAGSKLLTWPGVGHTAHFNDPETLRREVEYLTR